jgi:hypothetical protein
MCQGKGWVRDALKPNMRSRCPRCLGSGQIKYLFDIPDGDMLSIEEIRRLKKIAALVKE